jgi:hypothetical protein
MTTRCDTHVIDKRDQSDLTPDLASALQTVTAHAATLPVGTFKYKVFKYPGDVDIFEQLEHCCTFNQTKIKTAQEIQSIVKDVLANPILIYVEFKAGYDLRFKLYTGLANSIIEDYDPELIRRDLANLKCAHLLSEAHYQKLTQMVVPNPTMAQFDAFNEALRTKWVLRWTSAEILAGFKILPGEIKIYLDDALTHGSIVKLDTIARLEDRYVEMTNFFVIKQRDKYGKEKILSEELTDYGQSLLGDVRKYYVSNTLKAVKRFWMYLAFRNYICDLNRFTPLFESDLAFVAQIIADLEVVLFLIQSNLKYDAKFMYRSIGQRLSLLGGSYIHEPFRSSDPVQIEAYLKDTRARLFEEVNAGTKAWLQAHKIDIMGLIEAGY